MFPRIKLNYVMLCYVNMLICSLGMLLIDIQKAFDTIDHEILLQKMKYLGFSDATIKWFESYLTNQIFKVNLGDEYSSRGDLSCGVPQGSILGPLLFLLYVNDMPSRFLVICYYMQTTPA